MTQESTSVQPGWDDLRYALFLARDGSVRAAARALGVSHSTVLRRIEELEARLGVRLFEKEGGRYVPTHAGADVVETARELEEGVAGLTRRVVGRDLRLAGPVRVTLPEPLVRPLLEVFAEVCRMFPAIELTLFPGAGFVDLARREADLALRIADEPPQDLIGRKVADVAVAAYASRAYLDGRDARDGRGGRGGRDLASLDWVRLQAGSPMMFERWIEGHLPGARTALRVTAPWVVEDAVDLGLGACLAPCMTGDARPSWVRVADLDDFPRVPLWVLTHRDLRATARVRAVRDALIEVLVRRRAWIEGREPQGSRISPPTPSPPSRGA